MSGIVNRGGCPTRGCAPVSFVRYTARLVRILRRHLNQHYQKHLSEQFEDENRWLRGAAMKDILVTMVRLFAVRSIEVRVRPSILGI
jgi:hypothetical protein